MKNNQRGQVLLIIVLIMVVALTVSLSVASRTIVNIRITTEEENSQRAFSAAEAGVEQALKLEDSSGVHKDLTIDRAKITQVDVNNVEGSEFVLNNQDNPLKKDDGAEIWLAGHNANGEITGNGWSGTLTIFWGMTSRIDCNNAGLVITVFSGTTNAPVTTRYAVDSCPGRRVDNKFSPQDTGGAITFAGETFAYKKQLPTISNGVLIRVVPVYADTSIGVRASSGLPFQGKKIDSTGQSADTFRKVSYFQGYPKCPSEFCQYVLLVPK